MTPDLFSLVLVVFGARRQPQPRLQIAQGRGVLIHLRRQQTAIAKLRQRGGVECDEEFGDGMRLRERTQPHVCALQVQEHPQQHVALAGRSHHAGLEHGFDAQMRSQ